MKKLLFVIPTLGGGGAERVLIELINNLDKEKFDVSLLSIFHYGPNLYYLDEKIKYRYFFKKIFRGNVHFFKLFSPQQLYSAMIKNEHYDIVISFLEGPSTRIVSGCPHHGTRLVNWVHVEIHNTKAITRAYRSTAEAERCYKKYDYTVFVSETVKETFFSAFKNLRLNALVKYNTINDRYIQIRSLDGIDDVSIDGNKINMISVGRFTEQKGYERLLSIVNKLVQENYNIHLYLLGKGDLENKYRKFIENNKLHEHVTILGYKENPYKYVKNCDLFVCSSYREGYSTAVSEALIVGTPVVTTLCSGMKEMLGENNEYGIICDNNEEALYQSIKQLLLAPGLIDHYKQKAFERGKIFKTETTVKAVEDMLLNL